MSTMHVRSRRLEALPPFIFAALDEKRRARVALGRDVINVSIGDPDQPTPRFIVDAMLKAVPKPANHPYAYGGGTSEFREAAAFFMQDRFGVTVDPKRHVLACVGSKEGIGHLPLAVADPGDVWCIPEIHYPVYTSAATFAGVIPHYMPMSAANGWAPVFEDVPRDVAAKARLLITNHPNNPTASCVDVDYYERQVRFCAAHDIIAVSDQAYSEIWFDRADRPASLWSAPSADIERTFALEFHSLSKTFNMTGWRIAFAVGHAEVIRALANVKSNYDSGVFAAVQEAGAHALRHYTHDDIAALREMYRRRRDVLIEGLRAMGVEAEPPRAGFFAWAPCPTGWTSWAFAERCLEEADVVVVPGGGFSPAADGWFRIALTVDESRLREACARLARLSW